LSVAEVGLRVLLPWPMKAIVDQALGTVPPARWLAPLLDPVASHGRNEEKK